MSLYSHVIVIALLALFLAFPHHEAAGGGHVAVSGNSPIPLLGEMEFLRDPGGSLSIADVTQRAAEFKPLGGKFSQGYTRDVFWLRVMLSSARLGSNHWLLVAKQPYIDDIRFYVPDSQQGYTEFRAGDHVPVAQRAQATADTVFPLELANSPRTYYLRVQSTSPMTLSLALYPPQVHAAETLRSNLLHGLFLGLMLASSIISLFSAVLLRQRFFVVATLYLAGFGMLDFSFNGYDQLLLYPENPAIADRTVGLVSTLMPALFVLFILTYLEPRRAFPRLTATLLGLAGAGVGAAGLAGAGHYHLVAPYWQVAMLSVVLLGFLLVFLMLRHDKLRSGMMLGMFLPFGIAVILQVIRNIGLLPANFWTSNLIQVSIFLQIPFASIVVLLRLREEVHSRNLAQEREAAQRDFLNMVAHELRNPLAIVSTTLANIEARTEAQHPELQPRFRRIDGALARLNTLVDNALDENRLHTGKVEIRRRPVLLSEFAAYVQGLHGSSESHPLRVSLPDNAGPLALDRHWLGIAVLNLLDNAVKYTPHGGEIGLDFTLGDRLLTITVSDPGIGIPPADRDSIGKRFFRADNTGNLAGVGGIGLGLYLVRQVAELHGGKLRFASQPGAGSRFSLSIPALPI